VRQLFLRMVFHEVGLYFRVLRISCSTLLVWCSLFRVDFSSRVSGFPKNSLRWLLMKGAILFCSYRLLQRTCCVAFSHPAQLCLSTCLCASLEVLFPSVFAISGACISQVFTAWHCPLLRFLIASAVCSSWYLSGLFHPETLLGFPYRAFSFKRLVSSF